MMPSKHPFFSGRGSSRRTAKSELASAKRPAADGSPGSSSSPGEQLAACSPKRKLPSTRSPRPAKGEVMSTFADLKSAGFSQAQAEGVLMGRGCPSSMRSGVSSCGAYQAAELRDAGFTTEQLLSAGFAPSFVVEAGYSPREFASARNQDGTHVLGPKILRKHGFTIGDMQAAGYELSELRDAGFTAHQLRREGKLSLADLRTAGYTPAILRSDGFAPAELLKAGYELRALRAAGFTAQQLLKKSGMPASELREAGYSAAELRSAGVSPPALLEAGFTTGDVQRSGVSHLQMEAAKARAAAARRDNKDAGRSLHSAAVAGLALPRLPVGVTLPEVRAPNLGELLKRPPADEAIGPSGRVYSGIAWCCLGPGHEPRRTAVFVVESRVFEPIVLSTILCNVVTMAWQSPLDPPGTWKADLIDQCERVYLYIYTVRSYAYMLHTYTCA